MRNIEITKNRICIIGLGYVGLPLARLFSTKYNTIGYDIDIKRVETLMKGNDPTLEVSKELLKSAIQNGLKFTNTINEIRECDVYIVTVPTPIDANNHPNLLPLLKASETIGNVISQGNVIIYESTVYPGATEEECIPIIERISGLKLNKDFFAGYSPERINPGDKEHSIEKIKKITSGSTPEVADFIDQLYNSILTNGTYKASSIRVAEAAKIIENTQRDVNIALMNEFAKIFNAMGIDTIDVIKAAASKWNFINLTPGLVGGHCISVDPYYLIQKAYEYEVYPQIISTARRLNDSMGVYIAQKAIQLMNKKGILVKNAKILILGITFKANCPDIRNSKSIDVYHTFQEYTSNITVYDPYADTNSVKKEYGIKIINSNIYKLKNSFDTVILLVAHKEFLQINARDFLRSKNGIVYDVKGIWNKGIIDGRL